MDIRLIPWTPDLREELTEICNRVDRQYLSDRMPVPYTLADADSWLKMVSEHDGRDGLFRAIFVNGHIVGTVTFEQHADVYQKTAEIGYFLLDEYQSCGVMTSAVRLACRCAFDTLDINRITGFVFAPNTASCKVLEKNGFQFEGRMRRAVWKKDTACDLLIYGKLREDETA